MQQPPSTDNPVQWSTRLVMAWMRSYDDSREDVKKNILEVIETNDIDGLTLKQLRADSEEIHTLFPSLKERLTFKSMLRDLFKDAKCLHCHANGGSNSTTCIHESCPHKQTSPAPIQSPQLITKLPNTAPSTANHRAASNHAHNEETNHKSSGHLIIARTPPLLSPRAHQLPRHEPKETTQGNVTHIENAPPTSRAKLPPISTSMIPNSHPPVVSPREREINPAQMQRFIASQGLHGNQLLSHGGPSASATPMYPFSPIAGQFSTSVANQALVAALTARSLQHQQPYKPPQQQQHLSNAAPVTMAGPSPVARAGVFPTPTQQRQVPKMPSAPSTASSAPRVIEIVDKTDKDLSVPTTTSLASHSEHPSSSSQPTTSHPVTMPLIGTRGRPATKGAIRSAKISQKYKKIIQRMKSAHKQVIEIPYPAPLPSFSQLLRQQIGRGNIANFRSRFTYECAQYYMSLNPTPSHTEYRNISKTVVENFPVLSSPDEDVPWRKFNNQLSQAIRNIRRQLRSVPNSGYPPAQKRKYWRNLATQFMCNNHSTMTLSQLTQQQQQQQLAHFGSGSSGASGEQSYEGYDGRRRVNSGNGEMIILKEEENDDDYDDANDGDRDDDDNDEDDGNYDDDDEVEEEEDDSIIPAEWVNKKE